MPRDSLLGRSSNVIEVEPWVLVSAFRYAVGRTGYIVGDTVDLLRANRDVLAARGWDAIVVEEIDQRARFGGLGMDFDAKKWLALRDEFFAAWPEDVQRSYEASVPA